MGRMTHFQMLLVLIQTTGTPPYKATPLLATGGSTGALGLLQFEVEPSSKASMNLVVVADHEAAGTPSSIKGSIAGATSGRQLDRGGEETKSTLAVSAGEMDRGEGAGVLKQGRRSGRGEVEVVARPGQEAECAAGTQP